MIITNFSIEELKNKSRKEVAHILTDDVAHVDYSLYLRLCRIYDDHIDNLKTTANEVSRPKRRNIEDDKETKQAIETQRQRVKEALEGKIKSINYQYKRIKDMEFNLNKMYPEGYTKYSLKTITQGLSPVHYELVRDFIEDDDTSNMLENPDNLASEATDVIETAHSIIQAFDQYKDQIDKSDKKYLTDKIIRPMKRAITQNDVDTVDMKIEEYNKYNQI